MDYNEAYTKLEQIGQTQLLKYYDELNDEEQASLLKQIDETDFSVIDYISQGESGAEKGVIAPLACMELPEIEANLEHFTSIGLDAISASKVGAVLLAGGMGIRLGTDDPKGMYNIGLTKDVYIFQRLIENTMDVVRAANEKTGRDDVWVPFYIMTSEKNNDSTIQFFERMIYFGYNKDYIHFFR